MSDKDDLIYQKGIDYVFVLNEILQKINSNAEHIDIQTNNIVVLSSALFVFSAQNLITSPHINPYTVFLTVFSSLSAITGLFALNPPAFMDKRGQTESKFYSRGITEFKSARDYLSSMNRMLKSESNTIEEYSLEIFNLAKYSYLPKRNLFNLAKGFLVIGFVCSFVSFLFQISS